ncbi:MAG: hypothetical protein ACUVUC_05930 [Thermoguttaceae bacterium]
MKKLMGVFGAFCLASAVQAGDPAGWYPFAAKSDPAPGEIGLQDWIDKPAGQHGRIVRQGDRLVYGGKPIKLWGLNLCYTNCAPPKPLADKRAAFYPKYGINSVRLHKYADGPGWAGIQSEDSCARFDPDALDRMDYQVARFKQAGIFVTLSAHFGTIKVGPADKKDVPYLEEFGRLGGKNNRVTAPHSGLFYSPELQGLHIRQTVNLLRHRNPYTGLTYAEDPAVCVLEIVNEQSVLFYTSMEPLKISATLRNQVGQRFCDWLRRKYGSHDGLVRAWGARALDSFRAEGFHPAGEHLDRGNILPLGNPWFWDPDQLGGSQAFRRQRLLDTLEFLYQLQCECYDRYVKAVRQAGYTGEILGSNWQAGRALSHFANLHSDWRVGLIDRHNYFGGGPSAGNQPFQNGSMLQQPGSGLLSAGLHQVIDRPFMLSEWIHCFPNEWGAEGPAILGAYGMGLQGWDASYMFQNGDTGAFSPRIGRDTWDATAPHVLGLLPAVARQVHRGDVKESDILASRNVHVPSLFEGKLGFDDRVKHGYDKQSQGATISARALAVVRSVVRFTPSYETSPAFDLSRFEQDGFLVASTGQLCWRPGRTRLDGFLTLDTPGTQAVVGFAHGQTCKLSDVTIRPQCRFAALYVTGQGRSDSIAQGKRLLIVAMARARNTDMKFNGAEDTLLAKGRPPILMEPVRAEITIRRPGRMKVTLLDHDGMRTAGTLPVQGGAFTIDGAKDKTPYYLVEFE